LDSYNWLVNDITQIGINIDSVDIDVGTVKFSPEDFKGLENEIMKKLIKNIKNSPAPPGACTASVKKGILKTSELKTKMDAAIEKSNIGENIDVEFVNNLLLDCRKYFRENNNNYFL
jgi:hypothetical protein